MDKLICIICGMEKSGTTYLANLLNSHSNIFSGFETGILLGNLKEFNKIEPYNQWLSHGSFQWGLPDNFLKEIESLNYNNIYEYIYDKKGSKYNYEDMTPQYFIKKSIFIFDKTPSYIYDLKYIYNKLNNTKIPFIIILKNFNDIYNSFINNSYITEQEFYYKILKVIETLNWIKKSSIKNIYIFSYDKFINDKQYIKKFEKVIYSNNPKLKEEELNINNYIRKVKNYDYPFKNWEYKKYDESKLKSIIFIKKIYEDLVLELSI